MDTQGRYGACCSLLLANDVLFANREEVLGGGGGVGARKISTTDMGTHARNAMPLQQQSNKHHNTKGCILYRITSNTHHVILSKQSMTSDEHNTDTMVNDNSSIHMCNSAKRMQCTQVLKQQQENKVALTVM